MNTSVEPLDLNNLRAYAERSRWLLPQDKTPDEWSQRTANLAGDVLFLIEQFESYKVALSFYADSGKSDGGILARSILNGEKPPEHVLAFFRDLHGVSSPASSHWTQEELDALKAQASDRSERFGWTGSE